MSSQKIQNHCFEKNRNRNSANEKVPLSVKKLQFYSIDLLKITDLMNQINQMNLFQWISTQ